MAFKDRRNSLGLVSVHRAELTTRTVIAGRFPADAIVGITAGVARANRHGVAPDPQPEDRSHAVLIPPSSGSAAAAKRMAIAATWVRTPDDVRLGR